MYIKYDSLDRFEPLLMTLCNPSSEYINDAPSKSLGILSDTSDEEMVLNFNSLSELNFRIYDVDKDDAEENELSHSLYNQVLNRRLIFVKGIGYFIIDNAKETAEDDGTRYKDVSASSGEVELQNRKVPYIEDNTYKFEDLLEKLVVTMPIWTIGHIDDSLTSKYRTFEDVDADTNILSFMLDDMQDAYECIFLFDTINRVINCYAQNEYLRTTDIHLTLDDVVNSLEVSESSDDLYTAVSVLGNDETTITAINPLGTNILYDFSYFIPWMSSTLGEKVSTWQSRVEEVQPTYYATNLQYYQKLEKANDINQELSKLSTQITMYQRCRNNIVAEANTDLVSKYNSAITAAGGTEIPTAEISETLTSIDDLIAKCEAEQEKQTQALDTVNAELETLKNSAEAIRNEVAISQYFANSEVAELSNFIFEGGYNDEYVVITDIMTQTDKFDQMEVLYNRAKDVLAKACEPTQEFSLDVENFVFVKSFEHWSEQLETGCLVNVELKDDDVAKLFLSNMTINYDDHTLRMTFGNRFKKFDTKSLFDNVLGSVSKSANSISYIKDILDPIKRGELNALKETLSTSRNLTMGNAMGASDEDLIIDGSGYTGLKRNSDGTIDPHQIKIVSKNIVFTDDAWESCKTAIGEIVMADGTTTYGINAETIIGDLIIGNELRILNDDGEDMFSVMGDEIKSSIKSEITEEIKVGGTNLIRNTQTFSDYIYPSTVTLSEDENGITVATYDTPTELDRYEIDILPVQPLSKIKDKLLTFSCYVRSDDYASINADTSKGLSIVCNTCGIDSYDPTKYKEEAKFRTFTLSDEWQRISYSFTASEGYFSEGSGNVGSMFYMTICNYSLYSMQVKQPMLEESSITSDWSSAPEDIQSRVTNVSSQIDVAQEELNGKINDVSSSLETTNSNIATVQTTLASAITQTNSEWKASFSQISTVVSDNKSDFDAYKNEVENDLIRSITDVSLNRYGVEVGNSNSQYKTQVRTDGFYILYENSDLLWMAEKNTHVRDLFVENELSIVDNTHSAFTIGRDSDGSLYII